MFPTIFSWQNQRPRPPAGEFGGLQNWGHRLLLAFVPLLNSLFIRQCVCIQVKRISNVSFEMTYCLQVGKKCYSWFNNNTMQYKRLLETSEFIMKLECGPMPNVMVALPNIGGTLSSTPQSLAVAHYLTAVQ